MTTRRDFIRNAAFSSVPLLGGCATLPFERPLVRFGLVADVHHSYRQAEKWNGGTHYRLSKARLHVAVETFTRHAVDFVAELGDFKDLAHTPDGRPDAAGTALLADEIEAAFARFPGPRYHVLGNHEMDVLSKEEVLARFSNAGFARAEPHYSFERGGVTFVVLDACYNAKFEPYRGTPCNWTWEEAYVPPAEIGWLKGVLERAPGHVVVFIHQRLDSAARENHRVRNAEAVQSVLEACGKVVGVFQGHDHLGGYLTERGVNYFTLPAMVRGTAAGRFAEVAVYPSGRVTVTGFGGAPSLAWRAGEPPRQFANPVGGDETPDPFVTWDSARRCYYLLFTRGWELRLYRSPTLAGLRDGESVRLEAPGEREGFYGNFWAPEMHRAADGKWYVYTSGSIKRNSPWGQKRLFVLGSKTEDPFDGFVYRGKPAPDAFAIDPTVTTLAGGTQLVCYSELRGTLGQVLVVRELVTPWTFGEREVVIARAELPWELKDSRINEGAFFVRSPDGRRLFVVYSANGCFCDDYALGVIEYMGGGIYEAANWKKFPEPILVKGNGCFGPGHASFFASPDGRELWCAYHAMRKSNPNRIQAGRWLNFQRVKFSWKGVPRLGECVGSDWQDEPSG